MQSLVVPAGGLTLTSSPLDNLAADPAKTGVKPMQAIQLDLEANVLDDIVKTVRTGGKEPRLTCGKTTTLQYANKSLRLFTTPTHSHGEIYSCSADDKDKLSFVGLLSHRLAMKETPDKSACDDTALATLQSQFASHQEKKQSKQIKFVPDSSNLPPPVQEKHASAKSSSLGLHKKNGSSRLINATTRSMPASPSIGASRSPASLGVPPTSVPVIRDEKTQKLQALRTPLIHLLAVRQVSVKFLAQKTCCSQEECKGVLQRVGRESRLDPEKWDLSDKSFKELDVWKFAYPSEVDRQFAIDRAVSAFDRMRVSREEKLWQMLLPKHERGKGKILSKLNLHAGPIQKTGTPRINVQTAGDASQGHETGNDSDRRDLLAPTDAEPMARSKSHDQITKKRVSEKEAQSKRLLSKNPKKAAQAPKAKAAHPAVKKQPKKAAAASSGVPKSTEFVHDSDEDEDMKDVDPPQSKPTPATTTTGEAKKAPKPAVPKSSSAPSKPRIPENKASRVQKKPSVSLSKVAGNKPVSTNSSSSGSRSRLSDSSHGSLPMTKTLSRQRNTSSPHKPSPLGSSPPANASDFDNDNSSHPASSTSSTPLVAQSRRINNATPARLPGTTRPASQAANNNSDSSLKRKANDIDSDIHNHPPPLTNGQTNTAKRQKTSILSPPTSDSSSGSSLPSIRASTIALAERFKRCYAKYETLHQGVTACEDASQDDIDKLLGMHDRLVAMKIEIAKSVRA